MNVAATSAFAMFSSRPKDFCLTCLHKTHLPTDTSHQLADLWPKPQPVWILPFGHHDRRDWLTAQQSALDGIVDGLTRDKDLIFKHGAPPERKRFIECEAYWIPFLDPVERFSKVSCSKLLQPIFVPPNVKLLPFHLPRSLQVEPVANIYTFVQ